MRTDIPYRKTKIWAAITLALAGSAGGLSCDWTGAK